MTKFHRAYVYGKTTEQRLGYINHIHNCKP